MIGPSDLYRVPLRVSPSQPEELLRYARLEHDTATITWTSRSNGVRMPRLGAVRSWLSSHFGIARAPAQEPSLHAGLAAVHFTGDRSREVPAGREALEADHPCEVLATSALILAVHPNQPCEDACAREQ